VSGRLYGRDITKGLVNPLNGAYRELCYSAGEILAYLIRTVFLYQRNYAEDDSIAARNMWVKILQQKYIM